MKTIFLTALLSFTLAGCAEAQNNVAADADGSKYVPYEQRTGNESVVYFTRKLSAEGLIQAYEQVCDNIKGHVGVKLHTGEPNGPNIIPREWVKALMEKDLKGANIIETNTYYKGGRYTTEDHRKTLETNGWTSTSTAPLPCPLQAANGSARCRLAATLQTTMPWWH